MGQTNNNYPLMQNFHFDYCEILIKQLSADSVQDGGIFKLPSFYFRGYILQVLSVPHNYLFLEIRLCDNMLTKKMIG